MGEQVADRHLAPRRHCRAAFADHALALESRDELRHGIGEEKLAFFLQHHHGHAGDGLGHRRDAEDRVGMHGLLRLDILEAGSVHVHDLAVACDQGDDAADLLAVDVGLHALVQARQPLGGDPDALRRRRRQRARRRHRCRRWPNGWRRAGRGRGDLLCKAHRTGKHDDRKPSCSVGVLHREPRSPIPDLPIPTHFFLAASASITRAPRSTPPSAWFPSWQAYSKMASVLAFHGYSPVHGRSHVVGSSTVNR